MIAVLADIHGNLPALEAVLADAEAQGCDRYISLGDVAGYYPMINECVALLRSRDALHILGNHDYYLLTRSGCPRSSSATRCLNYQARAATPKTVEWIAAARIVHIDETTLYVHGSPTDPLEGYSLDLPVLAKQAHGWKRCIVGHSHVQFSAIHLGVLCCNPGSVGQPRDGDPRAAYGIIDGDNFAPRRVAYDISRVALSMQALGFESRFFQNLFRGERIGGGTDDVHFGPPAPSRNS